MKRHIILMLLLTMIAVSAHSQTQAAPPDVFVEEETPKFKQSTPSSEMDFILPKEAVDVNKQQQNNNSPDFLNENESKIDQFFSSTKILESSEEEAKKPEVIKLPKQIDEPKNTAPVKAIIRKTFIPAFNYKSVSLPKTIYHRPNSSDNRHLPLAYFKSDWPELLGMAVRKNDLNQLRSLANNGANIRGDDEKGVPLLIVAARHQRIEAARWLLMQGFNPNAADETGLTPLHYANFANNQQLISLLKLYKADSSIVDNNGFSPEDYAKKQHSNSLNELSNYN
jgi:ankyrin repeat protein